MNPDPLDQAAEAAQARLDEHIRHVRERTAPERRPDGNGQYDPYCEDCGLEIEPARQRSGRCRCFHCQSLLEKRIKTYGP